MSDEITPLMMEDPSMGVRRAFVAIGWQSLLSAQSFPLSTQGSSRVNGRTRAAEEEDSNEPATVFYLSFRTNI